MNMALVYGAIAGLITYALSKPNNATSNTPIGNTGNTIPDNTIIVTPTVTLPDPSTVVNPNPVVNVDPINTPNVNPIQTSGTFPNQLPGTSLFYEHYDDIPLGGITINQEWTNPSPGLIALRNKGWDIAGGGSYQGFLERNGKPTFEVVQDPLGQFNHVMLMRYDVDSADAGTEYQQAKLYKIFSGKTEIWERYYVRYAPQFPGQTWGFGMVAKQHYWRQGATGLPQGGKQLDFCSDYMWGIPTLFVPWQCCDASGNQDNTAYPNGVRTRYSTDSNMYLTQMNMLDQQWHLVEVHLKECSTTAANGIIEVFVDKIQTQGIYGLGDNGQGITPQMYIDNANQYRQGSQNLLRYEAIWEASGI